MMHREYDLDQRILLVKRDKIRELKIALPSLDEQRKIVDTFQAVDAKIKLLDDHTALTALFRTLLHQLMTAQFRVDQLDIEEFDIGRS